MGQVSPLLAFSCFAAFLGAVCFGWNTGVINNPKDSIVSLINSSVTDRYSTQLDESGVDFLWGVVVSIFAVGGMVGALCSGGWADRFGRRFGLLINCFIGIVAALLMGLSQTANSLEMLLAGRLLIGFCSALYTGLVPLYLTEVAPSKLRGGIGVLNQLGVVVGLFLSQAFSIDELLGDRQLWPLLLGLSGLPSLMQLLCLPFCPESPKHLLITKGDAEAAEEALARLRGRSDVQEELAEMQAEAEASTSKEDGAVEDAAACSQVQRLGQQWRPLIVGVVLHLSQQLSGINVIFYYSSVLFQNVGVEESVAKFATMAVGGTMIVMTVVSIPLMDRLGRRTLHLGGLIGITVSSAVFTILFHTGPSWASVAAALLVVVFFAIGPGSIPWMMMSEMFDQELRAPANAVGVLVNWSANFAVGILFSTLQAALQKLVFLPFTILTAAFVVFLYFWMPETKGKSADEVGKIYFNKTGVVEPNPEASYIVDGGAPKANYSS